VKILVAVPAFPWPEVTGGRIRLANTLKGLARLGDIDLFVMAGTHEWSVREAPPAGQVSRVEVVVKPPSRFAGLRRAGWLVAGQVPSAFVGRDYGGIRRQFRSWSRGRYDLVWIGGAECYLPLRGLVHGPTIVDLDNLEDYKIARRPTGSPGPSGGVRHGPLGGVRRALSRVSALRDARLWRKLQADIAAQTEAVVVCSEIDRARLGARNGFVIPNGYAYQEQPLGRVSVGHPPVVSFIGFLPYLPNFDAAQYLVQAIAPIVRARLPEVRLRLVGYADQRVHRLADPPRVVVTGAVQDLAPELQRADLIAAPIRFGGGTRIKILEAFAHRIPVVATPQGAEGLEVTDGREILIRESPESFADACVRLLTDERLRRSIADAAHALFVEKYRWDRIHEQIAALGLRVATAPGRWQDVAQRVMA
jgi:glycosyltransferase involved in cell wall biosynthesis